MLGGDHMKRMCSMCHETKEETKFRFMKKQNRYNGYCKECEKVYQFSYQKFRREKVKGI